MLSIHNMPEKFRNRVFVLDHETLSAHNTPEKFENELIPVFFGLVFEENSGREIIW